MWCDIMMCGATQSKREREYGAPRIIPYRFHTRREEDPPIKLWAWFERKRDCAPLGFYPNLVFVIAFTLGGAPIVWKNNYVQVGRSPSFLVRSVSLISSCLLVRNGIFYCFYRFLWVRNAHVRWKWNWHFLGSRRGTKVVCVLRHPILTMAGKHTPSEDGI